ncbi:EAL domain-containing protein [Chitinivorax sp. B]|uniref:bifunctional diguanylate cyclase/phosphodiesterase n=1 Tax=Chitinivorax sp. B TaxID=2502235 RepID=UPI0010F8AF76|nr:EAL domain-containing protein [Chitinivorax sp. B]
MAHARQSFRSRIFFFSTGLVSLLVLVLFLLISDTSFRFGRQQLEKGLEIAERVFRQSLADDHAKLAQAAQVLSADFGLREAVASNDGPTIASALGNHANRIRATLGIITTTEGKLLGSTDARLKNPLPKEVISLLSSQAGESSGLIHVGDKLYITVAAPIRAPLLMGWVILGFEVDDNRATRVSQLTGTDITFASINHGRWTIHASTLSGNKRSALDSQLPQRTGITDTVDGELLGKHFLFRAAILEPKTHIVAILQQSIDEAMQPYYDLRSSILLVLLASLIVAIIGSRWLSSAVAQPIASLANATKAIAQGDYTLRVDIRTSDEVATLAEDFNRMSQAISDREQRIRYQAYHDSLTDLPNYKLLHSTGSEILLKTARRGDFAVLLKLDIDRFRLINDALGYETGDAVIREVGQRLQHLMSEEDLLARQSGNEFAILITAPEPLSLEKIQHQLEQSFDNPIIISGQPLDVKFSIGAALFPQHGNGMEALMRNAEIALFAAKRSKTGLATYDPRHEDNARTKLSLLGELKQAIESTDQLQFFLQPKTNLLDGHILQAEALIRWHHPVRGFISPAEFVPFAEQTGQISGLTQWMLHQAATWAPKFEAAGMPLTISVNVSMRDIQNEQFPDRLVSTLQSLHVDPAQLCLEVTESGLMDDADHALAVLRRLHDMGFKLSIDDFGTGYSSLAYLQKMPVDELKIDRSFVRGCKRGTDSESLLRSIIQLGRSLGLHIVAEGVEDTEEWLLLKDLGCDLVQGYIVSKPREVNEFAAWLKQNQRFVLPDTTPEKQSSS